MRIFSIQWRVVHAVLCVCFHSIFTEANSSVQYMEALEAKNAFRELIEDEPSSGMGFLKKLIPIKEPRIDRNFVARAMPMEPDAEMLPAHYTGVKPPGVDHMELRYAESQISKVVPKVEAVKKSNQADGKSRVSEAFDSKKTRNEEEYQKVASFEKGENSDYLRKKEKSQEVEAGGKKKVHDSREKNMGYKMEQKKRNSEGNYEKKGNDHVDRKAIGYHNVYHKDEYKKDHDFYDNDDHGGHLKKHGRYNEKHVAAEGKFKKGERQDSGLDETKLRKKGVAGNSQADGESKGQEARYGYDGFFQNFQGFAKQTDRNNGEKSGFEQTEAR